ncbi:MAG: geranylgeranyl reductase family protein [Burkholderiales bacterium]
MASTPMDITADVLVVGLGPAGGAAAFSAASAGLKVIALERKREIGVPVQCAEFIPLPMAKYARGAGVLQQRISGMKSVLPSGAVAKTDFPGMMVDRAAFDKALSTQAEQAGATLYSDSRLLGLDAAACTASVLIARERQVRVRYRVLIAADGPHSPVARRLGLASLERVYARQYTVALQRCYADTDVWLSDAYPGGYAWLFPKAKVANVGLGMDTRYTENLKQPLDDLHRQLVREGLVGAAIHARTGGAIPVGGMREQLVVGNILFVGDAAGLTHPITGAGIAAAVISGERAGQAAAELLGKGKKRALEEFEEDVRDQFETALTRALDRRRWLDGFWCRPEAREDRVLRNSWIAFPEYFSDQSMPAKFAA